MHIFCFIVFLVAFVSNNYSFPCILSALCVFFPGVLCVTKKRNAKGAKSSAKGVKDFTHAYSLFCCIRCSLRVKQLFFSLYSWRSLRYKKRGTQRALSLPQMAQRIILMHIFCFIAFLVAFVSNNYSFPCILSVLCVTKKGERKGALSFSQRAQRSFSISNFVCFSDSPLRPGVVEGNIALSFCITCGLRVKQLYFSLHSWRSLRILSSRSLRYKKRGTQRALSLSQRAQRSFSILNFVCFSDSPLRLCVAARKY